MVTINFDVEEEVKDRAEEACNNLGLSMSVELKKFLIELGNKKTMYSDDSDSLDEKRNKAIKKIVHYAENAEKLIKQGNYYTSTEVRELFGV